MGIPTPLTKAQAPAELHKIFDAIEADIGKIPNLFRVVGRFPEALKALIPFYETVMSKGRIEVRYKELAYLKASSINGCRY